MNEQLKEIALHSGLAHFDDLHDDGKTLAVGRFDVTDQIVRTCASFLAALPKPEPVAYCDDAVIAGKVGNAASKAAKEYWEKGGLADRESAKRLCNPLYAAPPIQSAQVWHPIETASKIVATVNEQSQQLSDLTAHAESIEKLSRERGRQLEEQAAEIDRLIIACADHVTVRSEQFQKISEQAAEIERLRQQLSTANTARLESQRERKNMDRPDAPFPGMATAFEAHTGQNWTAPDWRRDTAMWAAAWKAALSHNAEAHRGARQGASGGAGS